MQQVGVLTSKYARLFAGLTQEVQAELNLEILEAMDGIEVADWARFGKVRQKWESIFVAQNLSARKLAAKHTHNLTSPR